MNPERPGPAIAGAGVARSPQLGTRRLQLWQCRVDLSWQPMVEDRCRKCGKPREIVGISTPPPGAAPDRTEPTGDAR